MNGIILFLVYNKFLIWLRQEMN